MRKFELGKVYTALQVVRLVNEIHQDIYFEGNKNLSKNIRFFSKYRLEEIPVSKCMTGVYKVLEDKIEKMSHLEDETMPPIVVGEIFGGEYIVTDGNHRVQVAKRKNQTTIRALVPYKES